MAKDPDDVQAAADDQAKGSSGGPSTPQATPPEPASGPTAPDEAAVKDAAPDPQPGDATGAQPTESLSSSVTQPAERDRADDVDPPGSETGAAGTPPPVDTPEVHDKPDDTSAAGPTTTGDATGQSDTGEATDADGKLGSKGRRTDDDEIEDLDDDDDDDDLDDDDDDDDERGRRSGGVLSKKIQIDARVILIVLVVLLLAGGAYWLGQRTAEPLKTATSPGSTPTTQFTVPKDFVPFEDKDTGIKLAIPRDWPQYSTKELDPSYRLLIGVPNAKDSFRVRVNAYSSEVTAANVNDQKAVVDAILTGEKVNILADETLTINGLPALFYVYKFTDTSGEPGIHAHFFVFQGRKMVTMVFEAVPEARYPVLAPVFDQIKDSLVVAPGPPPSFLEELGNPNAPASSVPGAPTAPGATTAPPASAPPATG